MVSDPVNILQEFLEKISSSDVSFPVKVQYYCAMNESLEQLHSSQIELTDGILAKKVFEKVHQDLIASDTDLSHAALITLYMLHKCNWKVPKVANIPEAYIKFAFYDSSIIGQSRNHVLFCIKSVLQELITKDKCNLEEILQHAKTDFKTVSDMIINLVEDVLNVVSCEEGARFYYFTLIPQLMETDNANIRMCFLNLAIKHLERYPIRLLAENELGDFKNLAIKSFGPRLNTLIDIPDSNWDKLYTFLMKCLGLRFLDPRVGTSLLKSLQFAFHCEDFKIIETAYECWKAYIDIHCEDSEQVLNKNRAKLLLVPLKRTSNKFPLLMRKKLDVWIYLLTRIQDNISELYLEQFLQFAFGPLSESLIPGRNDAHAQVTDVKFWEQSADVLISMLGHSQHGGIMNCVNEGDAPLLNLKTPVITSDSKFMNINHIVINAIGECCYQMVNWKKKETQIVKCLWGSLFGIISKLGLSEQKKVIQNSTAVLAAYLELVSNNNDYFKEILVPVFELLLESDLFQIPISRFNTQLLFPIVKELVKYRSLKISDENNIILKMLRYSRAASNKHVWFKTTFEIACTVDAADIECLLMLWKECAEVLCDISNSPTKQNKTFLSNTVPKYMVWPIWQTSKVEETQQDTLLKVYVEKWGEVFRKIFEKYSQVSIVILEKLRGSIEASTNKNITKLLVQFHPLLLDQFTDHNFLSCLLNLMLCLLEVLPVDKQVTMLLLSTITFILENTISKNERILRGSIFELLSQCFEYLLVNHKEHTILQHMLKFFNNISSNLIKHTPSTLTNTIRDLQSHSNEGIAKNATNLFTILNPSLFRKSPQTKVSVHVQSRGAKIANMTMKSKPKTLTAGLSLFGHTVSAPSSLDNNNLIVESKNETKPKKRKADDEAYAVINEEYRFDPSKLTEHQLEVMKRRKCDIPALYQDLSQSQSNSVDIQKLPALMVSDNTTDAIMPENQNGSEDLFQTENLTFLKVLSNLDKEGNVKESDTKTLKVDPGSDKTETNDNFLKKNDEINLRLKKEIKKLKIDAVFDVQHLQKDINGHLRTRTRTALNTPAAKTRTCKKRLSDELKASVKDAKLNENNSLESSGQIAKSNSRLSMSSTDERGSNNGKVQCKKLRSYSGKLECDDEQNPTQYNNRPKCIKTSTNNDKLVSVSLENDTKLQHKTADDGNKKDCFVKYIVFPKNVISKVKKCISDIIESEGITQTTSTVPIEKPLADSENIIDSSQESDCNNPIVTDLPNDNDKIDATQNLASLPVEETIDTINDTASNADVLCSFSQLDLTETTNKNTLLTFSQIDTLKTELGNLLETQTNFMSEIKTKPLLEKQIQSAVVMEKAQQTNSDLYNIIPTSPVVPDTPTKNSELINNTTEISPIKCDSSTSKSNDTQDAIPKCELESISVGGFGNNQTTRGQRLLAMVNGEHKPVAVQQKNIPKQKPVILKTNRVLKMMNLCEEAKCNLDEAADISNEPNQSPISTPVTVLTFSPGLPNLKATPKTSILKNKTTPLVVRPKVKRVNFSYPLTTCEKIYYTCDEVEEDLSNESDTLIEEPFVSESLDKDDTPLLDPSNEGEKQNNEADVLTITPALQTDKQVNGEDGDRNLTVAIIQTNVIQEHSTPVKEEPISEFVEAIEEQTTTPITEESLDSNTIMCLDNYVNEDDDDVIIVSPPLSTFKETDSNSEDSQTQLHKKVNIECIYDGIDLDRIEIVRESEMESLDIHTQGSIDDMNISTIDNTQPIAPDLSDCNADINCILKKIISPSFVVTLQKQFENKNLSTVGDLAKLTQLDIMRLHLRGWKLKTLQKILNTYSKTYKRRDKKQIITEDMQENSLNHSVTSDCDCANSVHKLRVEHLPVTPSTSKNVSIVQSLKITELENKKFQTLLDEQARLQSCMLELTRDFYELMKKAQQKGLDPSDLYKLILDVAGHEEFIKILEESNALLVHHRFKLVKNSKRVMPYLVKNLKFTKLINLIISALKVTPVRFIQMVCDTFAKDDTSIFENLMLYTLSSVPLRNVLKKFDIFHIVDEIGEMKLCSDFFVEDFFTYLTFKLSPNLIDMIHSFKNINMIQFGNTAIDANQKRELETFVQRLMLTYSSPALKLKVAQDLLTNFTVDEKEELTLLLINHLTSVKQFGFCNDLRRQQKITMEVNDNLCETGVSSSRSAFIERMLDGQEQLLFSAVNKLPPSKKEELTVSLVDKASSEEKKQLVYSIYDKMSTADVLKCMSEYFLKRSQDLQ